MALNLRRGTNAERLQITPAEGELLYTTDTKRVYVGDGATPGGIAVDAGTINVSDISDINLNSVANGSVLVWNTISSEWQATSNPVATNLNVLLNLNNINDVLYFDPPTNGLPLIWSSELSSWRPATVADSIFIENLNSISDVSISNVANDQVLAYNVETGQWENSPITVPINIDDLNDVNYNGGTPSNGDTLVWNGSLEQWEPTTLFDQSLNTTDSVSFGLVTSDIVGSVFADDSTPIIDAVNAAVTGKIQLVGAAPANSTSAGEIGEIRFDSDFLYICTAQNTWKRIALDASPF